MPPDLAYLKDARFVAAHLAPMRRTPQTTGPTALAKPAASLAAAPGAPPARPPAPPSAAHTLSAQSAGARAPTAGATASRCWAGAWQAALRGQQQTSLKLQPPARPEVQFYGKVRSCIALMRNRVASHSQLSDRLDRSTRRLTVSRPSGRPPVWRGAPASAAAPWLLVAERAAAWRGSTAEKI